jgi:hypothetical protein
MQPDPGPDVGGNSLRRLDRGEHFVEALKGSARGLNEVMMFESEFAHNPIRRDELQLELFERNTVSAVNGR